MLEGQRGLEVLELQMQVEFRQGYLSSNLVGSSRDSRRLWTRPHSSSWCMRIECLMMYGVLRTP